MNKMRRIYVSDERGIVHIALPVGSPGKRVEVHIAWREADESGSDELGESLQSPLDLAEGDDSDEANAAVMAKFIGLLESGDLERPPQDPRRENGES